MDVERNAEQGRLEQWISELVMSSGNLDPDRIPFYLAELREQIIASKDEKDKAKATWKLLHTYQCVSFIFRDNLGVMANLPLAYIDDVDLILGLLTRESGPWAMPREEISLKYTTHTKPYDQVKRFITEEFLPAIKDDEPSFALPC